MKNTLFCQNLLPDIAEAEIFQHDGTCCHRMHSTNKFHNEDVAILEDWFVQKLDS